jgi:hypothetical protein
MNLRSSSAVVAVCAAFAFATLAADNPTGTANKPSLPVIIVDNVPLVDAIQNLARQANLNYILDPRVAAMKTTVSGRWTNSSAQSALNGLLQKHELTNVTSASTSVSRIAPRSGVVTAVPTDQAKATTNATIARLVIDDVPLPEVIDSLVAAAKLNVIIDPKAKATPAFTRPERVSFRWEGITARQALMALLDNYDLVLVEVPSSRPARVTVKGNSETKP